MPRYAKSEQVPAKMRERYQEIVALTDAFCKEQLDEEYAQLARQAAAALCRKRLSPVVSGQAKSWACGIAYAIGQVNFLFDRSQEPYIAAADLCAAFGVSSGTGSSKAKTVRDALDMSLMDPHWYRPSQLDDNPMAWLISVDGYVVDARSCSPEVQEIAYRKGLIPYVPSPE